MGSQKPRVDISYPPNESFIRANVPIFGTAYVPGEDGKIKQWVLEYGVGRSPTQWTRLKQSEQPENYDPNTHGEVVWDVNKEPTGNLTNWAVGLTSYSYANWGKNLNGIYTLRLRAETDSGEYAETRRTYYVGEAAIRLYGGTGISADFKCRLSLPAFSFGGEQSRIIAIIKQLPPANIAQCKTVKGVEETDPSAAEIYQTIPDGFQLQSAIYRLYPAGLQTDPAATLEVDFDPQEFSPANTRIGTQEGSVLCQWNPATRLWVPLQTQWIETMARAQLPSLCDVFSYVALIKRMRPVPAPDLTWVPISALSGYWTGKTSPHTVIKVTSKDGRSATGESDDAGYIRLPFRLSPGTQLYGFELTPVEGKAFSRSLNVMQRSGEVLTPVAPSLRVLGGHSTISVNNKLTLLCQDSSLSNPNEKAKRSILAQVQTGDASRSFTVELAETLPGMGDFIGCLMPEDSQEPDAGMSASVFPPHLQNGSKLIISVGSTQLRLTVENPTRPKITLFSVTHPCLLFANPQSGGVLQSSQSHSQCSINVTQDGWKLSGASGAAVSARVAYWPVNGFQTSSWPFIGFTYKLQRQAPWQLILRSDKGMAAFRFACEDSWFDAYASTDPLMADGQWHGWQQSLQHEKFQQINTIAFGSWIKTGYLRVEPGFTRSNGNAIVVKDLWVGRSYTERLVEMQWSIDCDTPMANLEWWVDRQADSPVSSAKTTLFSKTESPASFMRGKCSFSLPEAGSWFFHIRAVDQAGNASYVANYPLMIYATQGRTAALAERALNAVASQTVSWKQPEGSFQVKLEGFGGSLNSKSLVMRIGATAYPLSNASWNASTETLTVDAASFGTSPPIGFDRETLSSKLEARDMQGKPILNLPDIDIRITSPFLWKATETGGILKVALDGEENKWVAFWKTPTPPWSELFPGCVNNTLVATNTWRDKTKPTPKAPQWERPLVFTAPDAKPIYWEESWLKPIDKIVSPQSARDHQIFTFDGSPAGNPGKMAATDTNTWVFMQTPTDPFESGFLRMVSRGKSGELNLSRVTASEATQALNQQKKNSLRFDGWLRKGDGFIYIKASGKRKIQFASDDGDYRLVSGDAIRIEATAPWTRFSILVTPNRDYTPQNASLNGKFYW